MSIFSKPKPVSKTSPKLLSLAFTNIRGLRTNFSHVESFLTHTSPDILALCETNLNPSIDSGDFVVDLSHNTVVVVVPSLHLDECPCIYYGGPTLMPQISFCIYNWLLPNFQCSPVQILFCAI